jgi:chromosome partitioning protein
MTMFDVRTKLSRQVVEEVQTHLPDKIFATVIPRTVRLSEAPSFGKTIFAYDPMSPGATAYRNLSKEVISRFKLKGSEPLASLPPRAPAPFVSSRCS